MSKASGRFSRPIAALGVIGLLSGGYYVGQLLGAPSAPKLEGPPRTYYVRSVPTGETAQGVEKADPGVAAVLAAHGRGGSTLPQVTSADLEDPQKHAELDRLLGGAKQYSVTGDARKNFDAEKINKTWAAPLERDVRQLFADPELAEAELVEIECRSSMCRIEVAFDSMQTFQNVMRVSAVRGPLVGATGLSDIEEHRVVAYVTPNATRSPG